MVLTVGRTLEVILRILTDFETKSERVKFNNQRSSETPRLLNLSSVTSF